MARKKDSPQKAALREMMSGYMKENGIRVKDGTDVNSINGRFETCICSINGGYGFSGIGELR